MRMFFASVVLGCYVLFSNCTFNATRSGMGSDKKDGEKIANAFFGMLIDHDYSKTDKLFSEELLKVLPSDSLHKILESTTTKLGAFKSNALVEWNTLDVSGTDSKTEYLYVYDVKFEKYDAKITLGMLRKEDEEDIKILKFDIESPGFLQ